jgi:hypothetical protein
MVRTRSSVLLVSALLLAACSSKGDSQEDSADGDAGLRGEDVLDLTEREDVPSKPKSDFTYNSDKCKTIGPPLSAVTSHVEATIEQMDLFAARLSAEGFDVFRGPADPVPPEGGNGDVVVPGGSDSSGDSVPAEDVKEAPVWSGGEYLVARTSLSDMIFLLQDGTIGVASWCPAHSLGQIRRLDYSLADAVAIWASPEVANLDYQQESAVWTRPSAYYTLVEGGYQRTYMNPSLDLNESHDGQLSISGKPLMVAFALYGHADAPSTVGDIVGMELLKIGSKTVAEKDTVTVTAQVVRLWEATPYVGDGENPIVVDAYVMDATIEWNCGVYDLFADAVFPDTVHGSFVLNLQGAPPGKLIVSKPIDSLLVPPTPPLF